MLNEDANFTLKPNIREMGEFFRNYRGDWVMGFTIYTTAQDIFQLKTLALLAGLNLAIKHNIKPLEINVDTKQLNDMFSDKDIASST